jgi:hypothetical protein
MQSLIPLPEARNQRSTTMLKISLAAAAIGLAAIVALSAANAAAPNTVAILGAGNSSCGTWTADRRNTNQFQANGDMQWVTGYISGIATQSPDLDPLRGVDGDALIAWMDNTCQAHPLIRIVDAANLFIKEHPGKQG